MTKLKLTAIVLSFALLSSLASFAQVTGVGLRITDDVTLTVGNSSNAQFATIHEALDCLADKFIPSNVTVTIWVEPGNYSYNQAVTVNHANGDRIKITGGDPGTFNDVTITFNGTNGFVITSGARLGGLAGMTIDNSSVRQNSGISVTHAGFAQLGPRLRVMRFNEGITLINNSTVVGQDVDLQANHYGAYGRYHTSLYLHISNIYHSTGYAVATQWNSTHLLQNSNLHGGAKLINFGGVGN